MSSQTYETDHKRIGWDNLKLEVAQKIEFLHLSWAATQRDNSPAAAAVHKKLVNDIYVPAIKLLAEFCACIEVDGESGDAHHE